MSGIVYLAKRRTAEQQAELDAIHAKIEATVVRKMKWIKFRAQFRTYVVPPLAAASIIILALIALDLALTPQNLRGDNGWKDAAE